MQRHHPIKAQVINNVVDKLIPIIHTCSEYVNSGITLKYMDMYIYTKFSGAHTSLDTDFRVVF